MCVVYQGSHASTSSELLLLISYFLQSSIKKSVTALSAKARCSELHNSDILAFWSWVTRRLSRQTQMDSADFSERLLRSSALDDTSSEISDSATATAKRCFSVTSLISTACGSVAAGKSAESAQLITLPSLRAACM